VPSKHPSDRRTAGKCQQEDGTPLEHVMNLEHPTVRSGSVSTCHLLCGTAVSNPETGIGKISDISLCRITDECALQSTPDFQTQCLRCYHFDICPVSEDVHH
jgi:hypothetical protein